MNDDKIPRAGRGTPVLVDGFEVVGNRFAHLAQRPQKIPMALIGTPRLFMLVTLLGSSLRSVQRGLRIALVEAMASAGFSSFCATPARVLQ